VARPELWKKKLIPLIYPNIFVVPESAGPARLHEARPFPISTSYTSSYLPSHQPSVPSLSPAASAPLLMSGHSSSLSDLVRLSDSPFSTARACLPRCRSPVSSLVLPQLLPSAGIASLMCPLKIWPDAQVFSKRWGMAETLSFLYY
jgi:hypothetical protein